MSVTYPDEYSNPYDSAKQFYHIAFKSDKYLTHRELNELQSLIDNKRIDLIGSLFPEGAVIEGGQPYVNSSTGAVKIDAGKVYAGGDIIPFAQVTSGITIPLDEEVQIGVFLQESIITSTDDADLLDDTPLMFSLQVPTSDRLKKEVVWGYKAESSSTSNTNTFYPAFTVLNGVLIIKQDSPQLSKVQDLVAKYDKDANGSYRVSGLHVEFEEADENDNYIFNITEGTGNVNGYKTERTASERLSYEKDPELSDIENENHTMDVDTGTAVITTNYSPISDLDAVRVTLRTTESVSRGAVINTSDALLRSGAATIISVTQGMTTYVQGTDYQLTGSSVDWSLGGAEPSIGTTYSVTYNFTYSIPVGTVDFTDTTITVEDQSGVGTLVDGGSSSFDYSYKLKRIDLLEMTESGAIRRVKGIPHRSNPQKPSSSPDALEIATITYDWHTDPGVTDSGPLKVIVGDLNRLQQQVQGLFELYSSLVQTNNAKFIEEAANKGVFIDTFSDDSQRDDGLTNDAITVTNALTNNIVLTVVASEEANNIVDKSLAYTLSEVVVQSKRTGSTKINPYNSYDPIPGYITLFTGVDNHVPIYTQQAIVNVHNTDPTNIMRNPKPEQPDLPLTPTPTFLEAYNDIRGVVKDFLGSSKVNARQNAKIINAAIKLAAGEDVETVRIRGVEVPIT